VTALSPNSAPWQAERDLLDLLALVTDIDERRRVILEQAFHEGSWDSVFDEARFMANPLSQLKQELQNTYCRVVALIRELNAEGA